MIVDEIIFSDEEKSLYPVGVFPPLGFVPQKMYAWVIREGNLGSVRSAFREEIVDVPTINDDEVLIANITAGVNYNGIWAATGTPINVVRTHERFGNDKSDFHICGSECCGIVWAVGKNVTDVKVGDRVCVNSIAYEPDSPEIRYGECPPEYSSTAHIWGYESNWGSFAQFSKVYGYQCIKKPESFTYAEAACALGTGATVYRMLTGWKGNEIHKGSIVLVWGGAGGLGSYAIRLVKAFGGKTVAVVSDDEKGKWCVENGAVGYINRCKYAHWGSIDGMSGREYQKWLVSATKFRNHIYSIIGEKKLPDIVIEHPGSDTLPTSLLVCSTGGMVVLCGATSGYTASVDLRHLWIYQKRIQGSHSATRDDCERFLRFSEENGIKPDISAIYSWSGVAEAHEMLRCGSNVRGQAVVRIAE